MLLEEFDQLRDLVVDHVDKNLIALAMKDALRAEILVARIKANKIETDRDVSNDLLTTKRLLYIVFKDYTLTDDDFKEIKNCDFMNKVHGSKNMVLKFFSDLKDELEHDLLLTI